MSETGNIRRYLVEKPTIFHRNPEYERKSYKVLRELAIASNAVANFPKASQTIIRWFGEIVNYVDNRTINGVVEGINNKLKLIKRAAYGFANFENFKILTGLTHRHERNREYLPRSIAETTDSRKYSRFLRNS